MVFGFARITEYGNHDEGDHDEMLKSKWLLDLQNGLVDFVKFISPFTEDHDHLKFLNFI